MRNECSPTTSDIKHSVTLLQVELLANEVQFVVLQLLESLHSVHILDDTRSVDHSWSEEPRVKVVSSVIVVLNLLLVLGLRVDDDLGDKVEENVTEELDNMSMKSPQVVNNEDNSPLW